MLSTRSKKYFPEYTKACEEHGQWWVRTHWLDEDRNPTPDAPEAFRKEIEANQRKTAEERKRLLGIDSLNSELEKNDYPED